MTNFDSIIINNKYDYISNPDKFTLSILEDGDIFWSEELKCWIITSKILMKNILSNNENFSVKRNKLTPLLYKNNEIKNLHDFYSKWLMYIDPPEHTIIKKELMSLFNLFDLNELEILSQNVYKEHRSKVNDNGLLNNDLINRMVLEILFKHFNISIKNNQKFIIESIHQIIDLIGKKEEPKLEEVFIIQEKLSFIKNKILCEITNKNLLNHISKYGEDYFIATIMDGYESIITSIYNFIYFILEKENIYERINEKLIETCFNEIPPFKYISRKCIKDLEIFGINIKKNQKIKILLLKDENDKNLSFGYGIHYCIGVDISKIIITTILKNIFKDNKNIKIKKPVIWMDSLGYRKIEHLKIFL